MNVPTRHTFSEVIKVARVKPRVRKILRYVSEEITTPELRDFLTVTDKSGHEGVLLYDERIVPFELAHRAAKPAGNIAAVICDICATWRRGPETATMTFPKGDKSTVTYLVCGDLDCSLHVRGFTTIGQLSRSQIREDITPEKRIERLTMRLGTILAGLDV